MSEWYEVKERARQEYRYSDAAERRLAIELTRFKRWERLASFVGSRLERARARVAEAALSI